MSNATIIHTGAKNYYIYFNNNILTVDMLHKSRADVFWRLYTYSCAE